MTTPLSSVPQAQSAVSLAAHTTLRLGGPAARFLPATSATELIDAVRAADTAGEPLLLLGGGSNVVVGDAGFAGLVVRVATTGRRVDSIGDGLVELTVEAGEDWDSVVADAVDQGLGGLECLSGVPGLVGATPVQNVGAYGVEIADLLTSVDLLDRRSGQVRRVAAAELGLGYRTSVLKGTDSAVVLRARFRLTSGGESAPIRYAELARVLGVGADERVPAEAARQAVLELRRGKGMVLDPADHDTWSAGSFFTNPVLDADTFPLVLARIQGQLGEGVAVPSYPAADGHHKLSAAWLIERAGFTRGHQGPGGRVALSGKHTLALTNRGGACAEDLLTLAREVRDGVRSAFGVELRPEPVLVGCAL
ncbi:UDP-N-acetylmuramate dehydrogenase [Goodfellowiella coeruleoviolacea]|uniref:UDP-N-acetylenolpyruvoylglucosamine reductase n=1 Tax=Goodfellowiella coeruleoviolacea TaxID=334858 RepID=A0AAE3GET5_9PSEU|nr:UDP-N-acetylmuramate dehydrogenase [Goodfellowiella coeruleoviolacea]MCP2166029.1 UDP-N-acetylmuramate dehydrogenase [Goodfellowiella coeruleoviolacea]